MEQTKSRSKSPAARILSLALALCMIAAFVPAFTLTVGAASYTSDYLVENANYTFTYGDISSTWTNVYFGGTEAETTNWAGWSSDSTNLRLYKISQTFIAVDACDTGTAMILTASDEVQKSTAGKDYIVVEWTGNDAQSYCNNYNWFDVAYADEDGVFDTFRYFKKGYTSDLGPGIHWDWGDGWAGNTYSNCFADLANDWTYEGNSSYGTIGSSTDYTLYRMVYANDEDGDGYTASYYYNDNGTSGSYQLIGTKTFAEGTVSNFTSMQIGGYVPSDVRIDYFKIYAGDYPAETATATIKYTVGNETVNELSQTYDASSATSYTFPEYYYSVNGGNTLYYAAEKEVANDTTETVEMTKLDNWGNYDTETNNSVTVDGKVYTITGGNIVPNGDFSHGMNGWYSRTNTTPPTNYSVTTADTPDGVTRAAVSSGNGGSAYPNSLGTYWKIDSGTTYYYSYWMKNATSNSYNGFGETDAVGTESQTLMADEMTDGWTHYEGAFTASNEYLVLYQGWASVGVAEVEIYPVEEQTDASVTVTVKYSTDGEETGVIDDLTYSTSVVKGSSIDTTAISNYVYNGKYYSAESATVSVDANATDDITYIVTLEVDSSKYAPTSDFSYHFGTNSVLWAGDNSFSSSDEEATIIIGWDGGTKGLRETIMTYNLSDVIGTDTLIESATLNMTIGFSRGGSYVIAAIDPSWVDTTTPSMNTSEYTWYYSDLSTALSTMGAVTVASGKTADNIVKTSSQSFDITLDLSSANDLIDENGTLALFIYTTDTTYGQSYIYSATSDYPPYLYDVTTTTAVTYTVKYVTTGGASLDDDGTYSTTADNTYGYAGEVVCSNVPIPYFTGYIFTSKSVDTGSSTITLTYTPTSTVDAASVGYDVENDITNFFYHVDDDTQFVSLNMLGSHDAFTSEIGGYDAALIARGDDSYAQYATSYTHATKTQDLGILEQLEAGARYFDIRLTRSDSETLPSSSYTTNGVFYTTHSSVSSEFRPILVTLYQWMEEHPGEVVSLYFQEIWDATADGYTASGDLYAATSATYTDLNALLAETGINDHVPYDYSTSLKNVTYGNLTSSGTTAGAVMFGRIGDSTKGYLYQYGKFYPGGTSDTYSWSGKLYTYYDEDNVTKGDTLSTSYLQTQVDTVNKYNEEDDSTGDHAVYHMMRVMQAQNELTTTQVLLKNATLLSIAESTNSQLYNYLIAEDYSEWLTALPVVMVNAVGTNTSDIVKLLQTCNEAHDITITYVDESGETLATKTKSVLVGSLYTDETIYTIVDNSYDETEGNSVVYSLETLTTKPSTSYGSAVVYTPSYGLTASSDSTSKIEATITIDAAELTDTVYTVRSGILYSSASNVGSGEGSDDNPAFSAYNWGSDVDSPDRVGFAIVKVPDTEIDTTTQYYALTATRLRMYADSNKNLNTYFYIVPIDDYNTLDVSDNSAIAALYAKATCIAADSKNVYDDDKTSTPVSYVLDADTISSYAGQTVVIIGTSTVGLYGLSDDIAIEVSDKGYGVDLYAGAQIRVGSGMDSNETSETYQELLGDSGLRFIAVVNRANTLAESASEIGIAIFNGGFGTTEVTAASAKAAFDETTPVTTITDTKYQDDDETVFTAAIIDIDENNYNRIYVAVPYVVVGGKTYYNWDATVARTPYQVAKGILVDGTTTTGYTQVDGEGNAVDSTALAAVLNVYTNKTGARVEIASGSRGTLTAVTYANGATAFFDITTAEDSSGNYVFTLTPTGDSAEFYDYAVDCFRINNASADTFESAVSGASVVLNDEGNIVITVPAE